jgi:glycosyltransferase involved in cell wall biosynthesis
MKFSIGIPAYKSAFLKECIQSILEQSFPDFELIIVNDASPEAVEEIVKSIEDHRIRYFRNEKNKGAEYVVENWNKCVHYAKGDFFILMGDDDLLAPDYLLEFKKCIEVHPDFRVFHSRTKIINEKGIQVMITPVLPETENQAEMMYSRVVRNRPQFVSDFVYNTQALKQAGGFYYMPLAQMSDDITAYILAREKGVANVNLPVFIYRQHPSTISSKGNAELTLQALLLGEKWIMEELPSLAGRHQERLKYKIEKYMNRSFRNKRISVLVRVLESKGIFQNNEIKQLKPYLSKMERWCSLLMLLKNKMINVIRK